ncbi:hypothetical protein E3O25_12060 [Cryobacterium sp. TMT1-3]|uniref:Uncharacterized protein n=1 Tax=Cryobacterium luteum TaxID=1424661 RepID=A0A1H8HAH3_9MICO|nr:MULTISPECIES: hypothetical protein [Cryobacterium]TFB86726.1 hypothetical protein E3O10_14005 [Cryobacterium luteum]TFC26102.1 hypothetical protein E3O25_12060 [Cryobacterium sp. TMT1-3]SEN53253.1 hypothetical protein SAMN05216281_10949 [Cryobacterium luteum]
MTPDEAKSSLMSLMESLQTELGGEWRAEDMTGPLSCDLAGGEGIRWSALRFGPVPADLPAAEKASATAAAIFEEAGYTVTTSFQEELGYIVGAQNERGGGADFGANTNAMNISAYSDCVQGDLGAIIDELNRG